MRLRTLAVGVIVLAGWTPDAQAQQHASVSGVVIDSIRGGTLQGAEVRVVGTSLVATTDTSGRFHIDSLPLGTYSLRLSHPRLDTLELNVSTVPHTFIAGAGVAFVLAVPSAATVVQRRCSATDRALGNSAILGVVVDATTEFPLGGATVAVSWTDYQLASRSLERKPQVRMATTSVNGTYLVCGVPSDLATGVTAKSGEDSTAAVTVDFSSTLVIQNLFLPRGDADSSHVASVVRGRVTNPSGQPVEGARVAVADNEKFSLTNDRGEFTLEKVMPGTREISVRKLGFTPYVGTFVARLGESDPLDIRLPNTVRVLEAVRVRALRDIGLEKVGFTQRQKMGMGSYMGPDKISGRGSPRLNYLLEAMPYVRRHIAADGKRYVIPPPGKCLRYYVDGRRWSPYGGMTESPDQYLSGIEIGAIEVYGSLFVPPEFAAENCVTVVVWTKWKLGML